MDFFLFVSSTWLKCLEWISEVIFATSMSSNKTITHSSLIILYSGLMLLRTVHWLADNVLEYIKSKNQHFPSNHWNAFEWNQTKIQYIAELLSRCCHAYFVWKCEISNYVCIIKLSLAQLSSLNHIVIVLASQ